jgi:phosphoribosyl-ATP pyrophosphohydrolase/phosphoribosyl-AMP cyclohydrolase
MELMYVKIKFDEKFCKNYSALEIRSDLQFNENGLVPMIIQDVDSGAVLSLFYCNKEALEKTKEEEYVWRYSRKLGRIIKKGESSGNFQKVVSIKEDCDSDAILVKVIPEGPACHTGNYSCFREEKGILSELLEILEDRKNNPKEQSYVSSIVNDREKIVEKLKEELDEFIEAGKEDEITWEAADLLFFMLVYLENRNIKFSKVLQELKRRRKK